MILTNENRRLELRNHLFWDVSKVDPIRNQRLIIERVLKRGNLKEYAELLKFYELPLIKDKIYEIKKFDKKTISFLAKFLNIDKSKLQIDDTYK